MNTAEVREARRQKILNNMNARMEKIKNGDVEVQDVNEFNTSECEENIVPDPDIPLLKKSLIFQEPSHPKVESKSRLQKLLTHNYFHTILLAYCSYFLLHSRYSYIIYDNAMTPFYSLSAVDYAIRWKEPSMGSATMIAALLGMYGLPSHLIALLIYIPKVAKSLVIYIFFLALFNTVLNS